MFEENRDFITQTKLNELRKQRNLLRQAYEKLEGDLAQAANNRARLRKVYEGLRSLMFAKQSLHPEVDNLDLLINEQASDEMIDFWLEQLEEELRYGQVRSEFVYIFGGLLEQWSLQTPSKGETDSIKAGLVDQIRAEAHTSDLSFLEPILDILAQQDFTKLIEKEMNNAIKDHEMSQALQYIRGDIFRPARLRQQAAEFIADDIWRRELTDTINIMLDNLNDWAWTPEGIPVVLMWTRNKWRLFLDEDLPTACLLSVVGARWGQIIKSIFSQAELIKPLREHRLKATGASKQIMKLEDSLKQPYPLYHVDLWAHQKLPGKPQESWMYNSLIFRRKSLHDELMDVAHFGGYSNQPYTNSMQVAIMFINAEVQVGRRAFPGHPLFVLKLDIEDFYPTIPHDAILTILKRLNIPSVYYDFFERYIALPVKYQDELIIQRRGISNDHLVSHMLAELILRLMDLYVMAEAQVEIIRVVDDICYVATSADAVESAWNAANRFCTALGMNINRDKCGTTAINAELPATVPQNPANWLMLQLGVDGAWRVDEGKFLNHLEQTRQRVESAPSIISGVEAYNANLKFLIKSLSLSSDLGDIHRDSVRDAINRFQADFFGTGQSFIDGLRGMIRSTFLEDDSSLQIPESWLHWPLTASGLGVIHGTIHLTTFQQSYEKLDLKPITEEIQADWQTKYNPWMYRFIHYTTALKPHYPKKTNVMENLVDSFINRGSKLTSGRQKDLSVYWRWVLYLYGPQILDYFGTFGFLITELVPLQLISEKRMDESSLDGE